jgi:hypothetical protein
VIAQIRGVADVSKKSADADMPPRAPTPEEWRAAMLSTVEEGS